MPLELTQEEKGIARDRADELIQENLEIDLHLQELAEEIAVFTSLEDLNTKIYDYYDVFISHYEAERRAINGRFVEDPVTSSVIDEAARVHDVLFPEDYADLSPLRVIDLDGGAGSDSANELSGISEEVMAIDLLLAMPFVQRAGSPEEQMFLDALAKELDALVNELQALSDNENYGPGSDPHVAAQAAFDAVETFLANPDLSDAALEARQTQANERRIYLEQTRLPVINAEISLLYDTRYAWLEARVHMSGGTRTRLFALEDEAGELESQQTLNAFLAQQYIELSQ